MQQLCYAALTCDTARALSVQTDLQPVLDALFHDVNPAPIKYAMLLAGYDCGSCRLPVGEISRDTELLLRKTLCASENYILS
jgi:4-hydroxy-tetrahydrodipicolinate synthase